MIDFLGGTATNQPSQAAPALTFEKMCADIKKVMDELDACEPTREASLPFGIPIFENRCVAADFARPARVHKRRRWMSDAYHRRVQKKWTKRFGYQPDETVVYLVNPPALGIAAGPCLIMSPVALAKVRAAQGAIV
ncbi:hypothetical protein [Paraburkholderia kururiensis]|uniref:hypothetical protein n=1 Tax=Paraburkholderia kururiensis TaxID=984307 RepID=UPI0005AB52F3|nr:hypothetical protein [Paraburkholderia kururiensis]